MYYNIHPSTKKRQNSFDILESFFVRHSLEYKTSDSDRKVNRNIYHKAHENAPLQDGRCAQVLIVYMPTKCVPFL